MNLKNLFAVSLAAVTLLSCTKEILVDGPGTMDPDVTAEGKAILTLSVFAENATRSAGDFFPDDPVGTEAELNNYTIFIFNEGGTRERTIQGNTFSGTNSNITDTVEISTGKKYFFAVVNAPSGLVSTVANITALKTTALNINDLTTIVDYLHDNSNPTGFLMTTLEDADNLPSSVLRTSLDNTDIQTIPLQVGRAMAKISVASNLSDDELTDIEYRVVNNPNQMYLASLIDGVYKTPFWTNQLTGGLYVDQSNYFDTYNNGPDNNYTTVSVNGAETAVYAMENSNQLPREGNSTAAFIKGEYNIEADVTAGTITVLDEDGNPESYTNGSSFWRIYKKENGVKVYQEGVIYTAYPTDVTSLGDGTYTDVSEEYENGVCYYAVWLRNDQLPAGTQQYTVKRNQYFKLDINSVSGLGEPDEDDLVDPEIPLDGKAWIDVSIDVVDWDPVEQGVDL